MKEKRNNMIKLTASIFLVIFVLSWLLPSAYYNNNQLVEISSKYGHGVGLFDAVSSFFYALTIPTLLNNILYIIAIAISYAVVSKLPAYKVLVNKIVLRFKDKTNCLSLSLAAFTIIMINLTGSPIAFLMFVPFIMTLLLRSGYAKKEAVSMVILGVAAGVMGSVIGEKFYLGMFASLNKTDTLMAFRLIQMILTTIVLFIGLSLMPKTNEIETYEVKEKNVNTLPLIIIGIVMVMLFVFSLLSWLRVLDVKYFNELVQKMMEPAKGAKETFWSKVLSPNITPFGFWSIQSLIKVMMVSTIVLALTAKMKLDDFIDALLEGAAKAAKPVIALFVLNGIIALSLMMPFMLPILDNIAKGTNKVFIGLIKLPIFTLIANFFIPEQDLAVKLVSAGIVNNVKDAALLNVFPLIWHSFSAIAMMVMPTSIILIAVLSAYEVSYKEYIKTAYKYILGLSAVAIITMILCANLNNKLVIDLAKSTKTISIIVYVVMALLLIALIVYAVIVNNQELVEAKKEIAPKKVKEDTKVFVAETKPAAKKETKTVAKKSTTTKKTTAKKTTAKKTTTKKPAAKKTTAKKTTTKK